jgi:Fic family protein
MRSLPKPPAPDSLRLRKLLGRQRDIRSFMEEADSEYYYWDDVRRRPLPPGLSAEDLWAAIKLDREHGRHGLPLSDAGGKGFSYRLPDSALKLLHTVDRQGGGTLGGEVDEPVVLGQMRERVLIDSLMEEAVATSQIEGAVTTRKVAKDMLRTGRKPRDRSEKMIVNGYRTIRLLRERLDRPLSIDLLHEIQESMTRDTLENSAHAGTFRSENDQVRIVDARDGEVVFTPPPAGSLPARMKQLIDFANTDPKSEPFIHPLIRAAILHFWLAYEHPYVDGNGRTARALFYWAMLKNGYWLFEFLTISRMIHASRMSYYRSFLHTELDDNDLTYFLMFQFKVTDQALGDLRKRLREITERQQLTKSIGIAAGLNARQQALLDHALRHPNQVYTFNSHRHSHGITHQTARTDILGLVKQGLLIEIGTQRPRQFQPGLKLNRKLHVRR